MGGGVIGKPPSSYPLTRPAVAQAPSLFHEGGVELKAQLPIPDKRGSRKSK